VRPLPNQIDRCVPPFVTFFAVVIVFSGPVLTWAHQKNQTMVAIDVLKFPISTPADTTPLERLVEAGYQPSQILAVVGKTEGE
jgi:hypothetical protein